jgi:hypothetical protein
MDEDYLLFLKIISKKNYIIIIKMWCYSGHQIIPGRSFCKGGNPISSCKKKRSYPHPRKWEFPGVRITFLGACKKRLHPGKNPSRNQLVTGSTPHFIKSRLALLPQLFNINRLAGDCFVAILAGLRLAMTDYFCLCEDDCFYKDYDISHQQPIVLRDGGYY